MKLSTTHSFSENKPFFTLDLIKEKLSAAYAMIDEAKMANAISDIMDICKATGNKHLLWFRKLLDTHSPLKGS